MRKKKVTQPVIQTEHKVGDTYSFTRYGLYSRLVGGDGKWRGRDNYRTEEQALTALDSVGGRYENVGGITVDFGPPANLYEYEVVRVEKSCTVLHVQTRKV